MRKTWLAAGLLVGCHAGARAPALVAARPVGNAVDVSGPVRDDTEAMSRWRLLGLTGADFQDKLDAAELDGETAAAMATALLRAGGFTCERTNSFDECGDEPWTELQPVDPAATFDDPCLRRELALWSLDQLGYEDAAGIVDVLDQLVAMPEPERDLQRAAFAMAGDDDRLRLHLMAHASRELAEEEAGSLRGDEARRHAVTELHLDNAMVGLAWSSPDNRQVLLGALADDEIGADVRRQLVTQVGGDAGDDVTAALIELADGDSDCALAQAAAEALAARGDAGHLPARPASQDVAAHLRAMCMLTYATGAAGDRYDAWIGRHGLTTVDEAYPDDPDVDPDDFEEGITVEVLDDGRVRTTAEVPAADVDLGTWLAVYSYECDLSSTTCTIGDGSTSVTLAPAGKSMVIERIETRSYPYEGGCGC